MQTLERLKRYGILIGFGLILSGCVSSPGTALADRTVRVWPGAPADPRIIYVDEFSHPKDLGIKQNFLQQLKGVITGKTAFSMIRPMAVVVTSDGVYYVADPGQKGVHRFNTVKGTYRLIRGKNDSPLPSPVALALGVEGEVYISDSFLGTVFVIRQGEQEAVPFVLGTRLQQPTGLAVDPRNSRLFVVDTAAHQVYIFAADGKLVKSFGKRGVGDSEFNYPTMIWLDKSGRLLVTDSMNFRVKIFDYDGNFIEQFGHHGDGSGDLSRPKGVAMDDFGHIYVTDALFHAFQIFDGSGNFLLNVGNKGTDVGEFWLPTGIFIGEGNTIYISDSHNHRVQIFRYVGGGR